MKIGSFDLAPATSAVAKMHGQRRLSAPCARHLSELSALKLVPFAAMFPTHPSNKIASSASTPSTASTSASPPLTNSSNDNNSSSNNNNNNNDNTQRQTAPLINYINYTQHLQSTFALPVQGRKPRDAGSLLCMLAFLSFLGYIIWDALLVKEVDVNLIVHGHDSYGNVCGRNNKPIKMVDKSGKNYTNKPFTKYTLINAQFERYTVDVDRLRRFGQLYYVKESNASDDDGDDIFGDLRARAMKSRKLERELQNRALRGKRAADAGDTRRNNRTAILNALKSTLMYQYPPMYGYNPTTGVYERTNAQTTTTTSAPATSAAGSGNALSRQEQLARDTTATTRLNTASSYVKPVYASLNERQRAAAVAGGRVTSEPVNTPIMTVMFDDHANDSEAYEHMLVPPTSTNTMHALDGATNTRARYPNVYSQGEASQQLLYLTECVEKCPGEDHVELIFYRCMPRNWRFSLFPNAINVTRNFIDDILTDVSHCYKELIYTFSLALVMSIALLVLLRFLASVIIWSCIFLLISLFISMASYSWFNYYTQVIDLNNMMPHETFYTDRMATSDKWLVGSIFLTFVALATIGIVIFMRKRILLVTALFRESGKAIADMPLLLLQPVLTFAVLVAITIVWTLGLICLQAVKVPVIDMHTGFVVFKSEAMYKLMKWYHVFAFLWVSHFAIACQHYVTGAAVSKWYFSPDRYNLHSPIGSSVSELILYYLGSVALGSFLVAIFKVLRIIVRQVQFLVQRNCMSSGGGSGGAGASSAGSDAAQLATGGAMQPPTQLSSSCCGSFGYVWRLFIWFFDNIVMIINRDAYVEIAIHGHSFVAGARQAFYVLASNPLRLLAIKSVSNVLLVVAKICVVLGTVSVAMVLLEDKQTQLNYAWSPVIIAAIYAYIVAHWFLSVYEMVIDALFICYCEDYERSKKQEQSINEFTNSNFLTQILSNSAQSY